ncbi:MAG: hypothetical protein N2B04_04370 [Psychrobacter sp.]
MFDRQPIGDDFTWMHSGQLGATVLNALGSTPNGQMLVMLDACLVDGFNVQTVASVAVSGSDVVLTFGLPHGYAPKQKITVSGSDDPLLNGSHRVISQTTDTVTLKISGVTNTAGVVKTKVSPLGFESVIGDTVPLVRGYRSKDPTSTKTVLHLDMSYPEGSLGGASYNTLNPVRRAMVTACTNVDASGAAIGDYFAGINNKPANLNGSLFWYEARYFSKSTGVDSPAALSWVIVGNGRYFYFFNSWNASVSLMRDFYAFGDMDKLNPNDTHNCILRAAENPNDSGDVYRAGNGPAVSNYSDALKSGYFVGGHAGPSAPVSATISYGNISTNLAYSGYTSIPGYSRINAVTGSMVLLPAYSYTASGVRARMPRLLILPFTADGSALDLSIIDDVLFIAVSSVSGAQSGSNVGAFAFDVRG